MRTFFIAALFLAVAATATAQVTVTGTFPANYATGVSTNSIVSITFSAAIDTTVQFNGEKNLLTNVDSVNGMSWSPDRRTVSLSAVLQPNTIYFILVMSVAPAGGGSLQVPYVFYFTTAPSFPSNLFTVSGAISPGTTGASPANAAVILTAVPFTGTQPKPFTGVVADGSGNFVLPYVPAGKWYPIAAKDADGDGNIDPTIGDPIAFGDSVTVTNTNVNGLALTFRAFSPRKYLDVRDPVLNYAAGILPANRELRAVFGWSVDSLARSREWQFVYTVPGNPSPTTVRADPLGINVVNYANWGSQIFFAKPITSLGSAALPDSVIARAERQGGAAFRADRPSNPAAQFDIYIRGGDLHDSEFGWLVPDTSLNYWGLTYQWRIQVTPDSTSPVKQKFYLANWTTGQIVTFTGVAQTRAMEVPGAYSLEQNYPNPFNPSTSISFGLPLRSRVKLDVYNLLGQRVASLVNEERVAGTYTVTWTPAVPSGIYFYRLETSGSDAPSQKFSQVRKMVYVK